ncbi:MAG: hypothetical protein ACJ8GW_10690 [Massilia sp.]
MTVYSTLSRVLLCGALLATAFPVFAVDVEFVADRRWIRVDSPHFSVVTEQSEETARHLIDDLESMRTFNIAVKGVRVLRDAKPLTVLAIGSNMAFRSLGLPPDWGGVFTLNRQGYIAIANINGYVGKPGAGSWARTALLHEYHHFLIRLTAETLEYPMWYDEGMADYGASIRVEGDQVRLGERPDMFGRDAGMFNSLGMIDVGTKDLFHTRSLPYTSRDSSDELAIRRFYARSYYVVHYFNSTPALRAELAEYLRLINLGWQQDRAVALAFKRSYKELDSDIEHYLLGKLVLQVFTLDKGGLQMGKIEAKVSAMKLPEVYAVLAASLPRIGALDNKAMQALLARNVELNPDSADAAVEQLIHGDPAQFAPLADALEKRFPKHAALLAYQGDRALHRAMLLYAGAMPGWEPLLVQARAYYRSALAIDPSLPAAYLGLGMVYDIGMAQGEPLQEGIVGFDSASIYVRRASSFSALARLYMRANSPADALQALRAAAAFSGPGTPERSVLLRENLEMLNDLGHEAATADADGLRFANGSRYVGALVANHPEGQGRLTRPNGSYYEGAFHAGLPHGAGRLVSDAGLTYEGAFDKGMARGQGKLSDLAGLAVVSYEGGFEQGRFSGAGTMVTKEGRYEGVFEEGDLQGPAVFVSAEGALTLRGNWHKGAYQWPENDQVRFVGGINAAGLRHGNGVCLSLASPGDPVGCEFKNGKRVGQVR